MQGTAEWRAQRVGHVTASRFADVLVQGRSKGLSKTAESYLFELVAEHLTGQPGDEVSAKALDWGHMNEAQARSTYVWNVNSPVQQVDFVKHPTELYVGGSPDGLVGDDGMVEIKCPINSARHIRTLFKMRVPDEYEAQVQGNLWITGRKWCDFVSFDPRMPETERCVIVRVTRDQGYIDHLASQVTFFRDMVLKHLERIRGTRQVQSA